ncbi:hypothetical protein [Humisphaera borealis]|uniref:Exosortase-associated EpsI family protein n=1 Tax=Humisphaera borealis TaxID=2807512 RepID=A0A7M2WQ56_9BACT|nr:hypothetical protein [Humisphaera borealis]QOV87657.1 hypothetical protein IPV69_15330 [Humisphaera borealis]
MSDPVQGNQGDLPAKPSAAAASSVRKVLREPRFLVAAVVLLVCAAGFNAAARSLQLHFRKQPVPLAVKSLDDKNEGVSSVLGGRWIQVTDDQPLTADVEHALGTKQYVMRTYADFVAARRTENELKARNPEKMASMLAELQSRQPEAIIRVGITYYTGLVDTVPHIPDRCMVADGYQPTDYRVLDVPNEYADGKLRGLKFRFITFEDITGRGRITRNVGYFFHVNGSFEENPLRVRATLQNLFETYSYFAKVELMTEQPGHGASATGGRDRAAKAMQEFLLVLLPDLERCLPDWEKVSGKSAQPPATAPAAVDRQ